MSAVSAFSSTQLALQGSMVCTLEERGERCQADREQEEEAAEDREAGKDERLWVECLFHKGHTLFQALKHSLQFLSPFLFLLLTRSLCGISKVLHLL